MSYSKTLRRLAAIIVSLPVMCSVADAEPIVTGGADYCLTDFNAFATVSEVQLNWTYSGAPQYNVYRSDDDGVSYQSIVQITSSNTSYLDSGLITGASYRYAVKEVDGNGTEVCQSPVVHVTPKERIGNKPPGFTSTPVLTAEMGLVYHYDADAIDKEGDPVRYSLKSYPAGMTIESESGLITWTPAQTGGYKVTVRAVDDAGLYDQQTYMLNVSEATNTNQAPQIVSTPVTGATDNQAYQYDVDATDPNAGDVLNYALTTAPIGMAIDSATGSISWLPGQTDIGGHSVTVSVADQAGLTDSQSFTLQVVDVNYPPSATDLTVTTEEDAVLSILLQGADIDGDSITFSIVSQPLNGQLTGAAPDLVYTPNADFNGSDSFTYRTHDGLLDSPDARVDVSVIPVNDAPVITSSPITNGAEGSLYQYQVQVSDPDSDTYSYGLTTAPAGMGIDVNGLITWTPGYAAAGDHPVTVTVQDGLGAGAEQSFTLTIADTNRAPVLEPVSDVTLAADTTLTLTLIATDDDGDPLTYQVEGLPAFAHHLDATIELTPGAGDPGTYGPVVVTVSDGIDSQTHNFSITVTQGNRAPVITSTPTPFVVLGDEWRYTLTAEDPDGDSLTYAMPLAPGGAVFDPGTGLITWATAGVAPGSYDYSFSATDSDGLATEQSVAVEVLTADRAQTHAGTEFWIPVSHNMTTNAGGSFDINLVSQGTNTEATIEIPALGVVHTLSLTAGQMATYSINLDDFAATQGFSLNTLLQNYAIHITAATPVSAYFMSQKTDTTDGFLGLPVTGLGREYITATYIMLGKIGIMATVDAGQPGPITTVVATEDNTRVTIDPIMDIFTGGQGQIEAGTPIELIMNRGDVYNLETRGSYKADLTGSTIRADKPVGVFGQMDCAKIPVDFTACDHIVEQLPPVESLATQYYTAPFWGRTENGRFWYVEYGDTFRAVAPYDNTAIYIDDVLRAHLDRGEYFEFRSFNPQKVEASHPVLLVQYSNGNEFDDGYRELEAGFTDPFMVIVPPAEQFLKQYTVNTPARDLAYNFVNLLVPTGALSTLTLDGQSVDPVLFSEIPNSPYSYSQLPITPGSHSIEAQEPFGAYVYGYDSFESYGYLGGMALSVSQTAASLTLSGVATQTLDSPWCAEATLLNAQGVPVNGARVRFNLAGATNRDAYRFADAYGIARYCYRGDKPGIDTVTATVNQLSQSTTVEWSIGTQNLPPVITSQPQLEAVAGESFSYQVVAEDPEGEALTYTLTEGPTGMTLDASGNLVWPQVGFRNSVFNRENVVLSVTDPQGLESTQRFVLREYVPFNTPPVFGDADISLTATVGVPYVYNQTHIQHNLQYLRSQVLVTDADRDAAFVDILTGPDEAYIQRVIAYYTGITRENDRRSTVGAIHYLRWVPQQAGVQPFELGLRDARGGTAQSRTFSVNVSPNLPPQIVGFNPQPVASVGHQYAYILNVENDVQPHSYANLDDLKVVFDEAPSQMRYELLRANGTQKLRIYWTPASRDLGTHTIRLHVEDRLNSSTIEEFTLSVVDDNDPPVITSGSMPNGEVSIPYEYQITATDPDGDALTYRLAVAPEGMTVNPDTGVVSWVPPVQYSDQFVWARFTVTDAQGLTVDTGNHLIRVDHFTNRAPEFVPAYRPAYAKVGREYVHQTQATDREGDYPISYSMGLHPPPGSTIDENGIFSWTPSEVGVYSTNIQATDSLGNYASNRQIGWYIEVVSADTPLDADLQLTPAVPIDLGDSVTLNVVPRNSSTTPQITLSVDGAPASLDALLATTITPGRVGWIPVTVTVSDGYETVERTTHIVVRDPNDTTPPVVELVSPATATTITSLTDIVGTVQDDNLAEVWLAYKRADQDDAEYIDLYRGNQLFDNGVIASLDPSQLVNGNYHILLQATDSNNNVMGRRAAVFVDGDRKVGQFSFTVQDLELSLAGIPVTVSRTYDSRRRTEALDFGYGWTVDYQNIRIEESQEPTQGWQQTISQNETFRANPGYINTNAICIYPVSEKTVSVTLPNNDIEKFRVVARPTNGLEGAVSDPNCYMSTDRTYDLFFEPIDGTQSTLETSDAQSLYLSDLDNGYLAPAGDGQAQAVTRYTLTTRAGYVYQLNQGFGVERVTDPNGHTLTYSSTGITHSAGPSVTFTRDANGRITGVTDPAGQSLVYAYSNSGDLTSVTERNSAVTTYTYNNSHGLIDTLDPLGRRLIRNIYDTDGRLTAQEDSDGNRTLFSHDLGTNQSVVTNRRGYATQYGYDERGNVTTEVDALNNVTSYTYDGRDNQLSQTDALGNVSSATYNANDDQLTQTDPLGNTISYAYNERGQETTITDASGDVFNNTYDAVGNLLSIEDPLGNIAANTLNNQGQVIQTTDALGNTTQYSYDANGYKATETDALGVVTTYTRDANGNVLTETRSRTLADNSQVSETSTYVYDANDRVITTTDALGNITRSEYDLAGNQVATVDALGQRTEMSYDAYGRLTETRYPDTTSESKTYDVEGNLLTETDRLGRITSYAYDALDRQIQVTYPDSTTTGTEYDALGRVSAEIDERGNRTEYAYDAAGRRISATDAQGNVHRFEYDADGNLTAEVDALNRRTDYLYNALDQRTSVIHHDNSNRNETFDALGRRTVSTDEAGLETGYAYDALGRLTQVTDALIGQTAYSYDEAGNKLTQTDAEGRTTRWEYDALGRVTARELPLGQRETFAYNANGNLTSHVDFNGQITSHHYDSDNRLVQSDYADGRVEQFSYDAVGNRTQIIVTHPGGATETTAYAYDARDRLTSETQPDGTLLAYQYDAAGNRTRVSITRGATTSTTDYAYDSLNRLQSVTDAAAITRYGYDAVGNRTSVSYPNGGSEVYAYDNLNRLTRKETYNGAGTLIRAYDYTLHATGRRTGVAELNGRSTTYSYDDLYRLTGESITDSQNGNYSASYQYDAVGNRTYSTIDGVQTAYTYDANDRLTQQGGTRYTYDANGNTQTETLDTNTVTYGYNAKNELVSVTQGSNSTEYTYNPNGIRTSKTEGGTTTRYIVDENRDYAQVLIEDDGASQVSYTYGDDLISQARGGEAYYYHYDGLGSTRSLTDSQGNLANTYDYEAFGELLGQTGTIENRYLFAGEQFDPSLDQYYLRARYYDQSSGRFTQQDTWMGNNSDPITLHKYLYANVDPVNNIDPTGNFSMGSMMSAINVMGRLSTIATTTYDLFKVTTGEEEVTAKKVGMLILMNYGGKHFKNLLPRKVRDCLFNSFPAGTLVHTESDLRKIEDIEIGQLVLSFNENTGENEYQPVTNLIQSENVHHLVSVVLESGEVFEATHEHPFYVNGIWVPAEKLKQGNEISFLGGVSKIASIATYAKRLEVFNLSVDKTHTFYVGEKGVLVHNQNIACVPFKLKVKGNLPRNIPRFPAAPDWAVKGPHFTITTNKGPVELFFKVDVTGKPVYTHVLGGGTSSAVKAAMKEADELFRNKAFRAHVANKAYNGWEISMQTSKGIKNPKSDVIFETVTNLMKGL